MTIVGPHFLVMGSVTLSVGAPVTVGCCWHDSLRVLHLKNLNGHASIVRYWIYSWQHHEPCPVVCT